MRPLRDIPELLEIKTGPFGTQLRASEYAANGSGTHSVVSVGEIRDGSVSLRPDTPQVGEAVVSRLSHYVLEPTDVVISRKGTVDRSAWIDPKFGPLFLGSDAIALRFSSPIAARAYAYALADPRARTWLRRHATGSTMLSMNGEILGRVPVHVLTQPAQQAIAEVLGALDDKIAANDRVVEFGLKYLDTAYARAQKQRGTLTFADVADLGGGGTPSTKNPVFWGGSLRWATPSDVTGLDGPWLLDTGRHITEEGLDAITSKLYPRHSLIMSSRASIGHAALLSAPTAVNQGFIVLEPHDPTWTPWLLAQLRSRTSEFLAWANGATFLELPKGVFRTLPVDVPVGSEGKEFSSVMMPLLERIEAAQAESQTLAATRDELLPLLMSGKITVRDAGERVEEVV